MQNDGNLVLYKCLNKHCSGTLGRQHIWASNTHGRGKGPYSLVMQTDNALVIYDTNSNPIWWNNALIDKSGLVDYLGSHQHQERACGRPKALDHDHQFTRS